jgi:hypothetical protein
MSKKDPTEEWIKRLDEKAEAEDEGEDYPISLPMVLGIIFTGIVLFGLLGWMILSLLF